MESSVSNTKFEMRHGKGLNVFSAAMFIAGELAGSGILALPKAVVDCGWTGLILIVVFCINAGYGGTRLARCWGIIEERYPEYRGLTRNPYATIAQRAVGRWGSLLVSGCIQCALFGASIVFLLMAAQIVQDLLKNVITGFGYCTWFLFFAIMITPPMWLGTPKDFSFAGVGAMLTTLIASVLIFTQIIIDGMNKTSLPEHSSHSVVDFFMACGVILFSYGGASAFPTIQNDMKERNKFHRSVIIGFTVIILLYIPVSCAGFLVYGNLVQPNVLLSLSGGTLVETAKILLSIHLLLAFFIVINPVCQEIEETFNVPHEFGLKRCLVRTFMVGVMIVVGETIPKFSVILSLVGGSTVTLTTFVLPQFFYMKLCDQKSPEWPDRVIPFYERVYAWILIAIGLLGGCIVTVSAVQTIVAPNSFSRPCYWPK